VDTNPYAPPKAAVADVEPADAVGATPVFFPVSRTKLIVLGMTTLSLYQIYWFYKNWALIRDRGNYVTAWARALFAVFFCYGLFARIRSHRPDLPSRDLPAGLLATGWIVTTLAGNAFDRMVGLFPFPTAALVIFVVLYLAPVLLLVPVQDAVNTINRAEVPDHDPNDRFTVWNWLWIVGGGLLTGAGILGLFLPEP
jgi:hypothetical protein